jgi:hypothetical protein
MSGMRSPRGAAAAVILLGGVALALGVAVLAGDGAEPIVHIALGLCFALLAFAAFDFRLPAWIAVAAAIAFALLAAIFLLQAASDLTGAPQLGYLAYDVLGQRTEKILGYAFPLWCAAIVVLESRGWRRAVGFAVLALVVVAEGYGIAIGLAGGSAPAVLRLLYLPVFVWLLLECAKPRTPETPAAATA